MLIYYDTEMHPEITKLEPHNDQVVSECHLSAVHSLVLISGVVSGERVRVVVVEVVAGCCVL